MERMEERLKEEWLESRGKQKNESNITRIRDADSELIIRAIRPTGR